MSLKCFTSCIVLKYQMFEKKNKDVILLSLYCLEYSRSKITSMHKQSTYGNNDND